ncbi:hypothetical protein PV326_009457, partial [Microctonus aethiopoides]
MDDEKADTLIVLVAEYKEIFDLQNKHYSNQQRKENIWREIASKLNETQKTEASTVHRKRKNSKKQEEAETMPELFLEFLDEKKSKRIERSVKPEQADYLEQFFLYMSKTVKTLPPLYQAQVK